MPTFSRAAALAAAMLIVCAGAAFAADASTTVDFNPLLHQFTQLLVDTVVTLLGLVGLWLAMELKKKWGIDIEAQVRALEARHRDTLHSAVSTWVDAAVAKYGPDLKFDVNNAALKFVLDGVAKSAPDAIKYLGVTETWIINKAAGALGVHPATA